MRELRCLVLSNAHMAFPDAVAKVPLTPLLHPEPEPLLRLCGRDEVLHLHLLELERAEDEVPGRDLVAERLSDLRDAERRLAPRDLGDVLEVDEDALRGLRTRI